MAQYEASTTSVALSMESSGLDTDTSSAIADLLNGSSTDGNTTIVEYDGSPTLGAQVVRVTQGTQLNEDPGGSVIIMDPDSQGANLNMQGDANRAVVAGGGDDNIVATGGGNITVETGGGNDSVQTGDGQDMVIISGSGNSTVNTGNGDDTLKITGDGNVTVDAGTGDDVIVIATDQGAATVSGGDGFDTVQLDDSRGEHTFTIDENGILVVNSAPTQLDGLEIVQFNDGLSVIADTQTKSDAARLYKVLFDREGDTGGLKHWLEQADAGTSIADIANGFEGSVEFQNEFSGDTDAVFVNKLYDNMAGRAADQAGFEYWTQALEDGVSRSDVATGFAGSEEAIQLMGINGTKYVIDVDDVG
jgi:hypothetical protein